MNYFLSGEKEVWIQGESGRLQAGLIEGSRQEAILICHPHPQFQGTMFNKVVTTAIKAGKSQGFSCLRFNYRGVGGSEGCYDHGIGEWHDAVYAGRWLIQKTGCVRLWLLGFSFGGGIAYRAHAELPCCGMVLICPSIQGNGAIKKDACPLWVIQAEEDEVIDPKCVYNWASQMSAEQVVRVAGASHFFHGQLLQLQTSIEAIMA